MTSPQSTSHWAINLLRQPLVDKLMAILAVSPFAWLMWITAQARPLQAESLLLLAELALLAVTMMTRHPPARVSLNPLFWLLAFAATYWTFFTQSLYEGGHSLVPRSASVSLAFLGFAIAIWARLSLGRNIGFVPAERRIVTTGAYKYVRHPIYTSLFINIIAVDLASFSWRNVGLDLVWVSLWVLKTFVEERFLATSPEYQLYSGRVRWRWMPYVA